MGDSERLAPSAKSMTVLDLTKHMMDSRSVHQFVQRMEGKVEMKTSGSGEGPKLVKQFEDKLTVMLNTAYTLTRNELEQVKQIGRTAKEQSISPEQAAQDLHVKLITPQQELLKDFGGAVQIAVNAGMAADETTSFLRTTIGVSHMITHLNDLGQTARAQEILDRYNKGATLADLHKQMREWGHSDWVKEELTRLSAYESIISAFVSQYSRPMAGAASLMAKGGMQDVVARIRSVDDLAKQKLEDLRKEDSEDKKLSPEAKRKRLREDAEKMLREEEEGKKTVKKEPEPTDLAQATSIRSDMRQEVRLIESARGSLSEKMPLEKAFNDPKFEEMFEQHRSEEVKDTRKYFQTGMVPVKVLDAIANIRPPDVASYGPVSQLALLRAYRKTLEEYGQNAKAA